MPLSPNGVEMAAIVSSLDKVLLLEVYVEILFRWFDSFPFFPLWDDRNFFDLPIPKALCFE